MALNAENNLYTATLPVADFGEVNSSGDAIEVIDVVERPDAADERENPKGLNDVVTHARGHLQMVAEWAIEKARSRS